MYPNYPPPPVYHPYPPVYYTPCVYPPKTAEPYTPAPDQHLYWIQQVQELQNFLLNQ